MTFSSSFFFSLISMSLPINFQIIYSICFALRFGPYSFYYYLFILNNSWNLNFLSVLSSFNFFIYQIWSSLFWLLFFYFLNWICFSIASLNALFYFILILILVLIFLIVICLVLDSFLLKLYFLILSLSILLIRVLLV
jgi:hypothetical protein